MNKLTTRLINTQTGDSHVINLQFFLTFNELCKFILSKWGIPIDRVELLISPITLKLDKFNYNNILHTPLNNDNLEIWCFDRSGFCEKVAETKDNNDLVLIKPIPSPFVDITFDQLTYNELISLLTTNLGWLSALEIDGFYLNDLNHSIHLQLKFLIQGVYIYYQYLTSLFQDLTKLLQRNHDFYKDLLDDRSNLEWQRVYNTILNKLIIFQFNGIDKNTRTLQDLVELNILTKFDTQMNQLQVILDDKFDKINNDLNQIEVENNDLSTTLNDMKSKEYVNNDTEEVDYLTKFKTTIEHVKEFSRNILNDSTYDDTTTKLNKVLTTQLIDLHKTHLTYLFQESNTLYNKSLNLIENKIKLQQDIKSITSKFHQIQINIMDLKRFILNNLNRDLKQFQSLDVAFAHMEDLPVVYGLYIIEMWRKLNWTLLILVKCSSYLELTEKSFQRESLTRNKWMKIFGSISSIFINDSSNIISSSDGSNMDVSLLDIESLKQQLASSIDPTDIKSIISSLKNSCNELLKFIEYYIMSFNKLTDNKEVIKVLRKRLMEAQINQFEDVVMRQNRSTDNPHPAGNIESPNHEGDISLTKSHDTTHSNKSDNSDLIRSYKRRIQKLESLLHEAKYSNLTSWPTTVLNNSIEDSICKQVNFSDPGLIQDFDELKEIDESDLKLLKIRVVQLTNETNQLTKETSSLRDQLTNKDSLISEKNSKLSDMNLENAAYKEILTNLNVELLRLTNSEDKLTAEVNENKIEYMNQIQKLLNNNKLESERLDKNNDEFKNNLEEKIKQLQEQQEEQRKTFQEEKESWENTKSQYEFELVSLKEQNETLKGEKENLAFNKMKEVANQSDIFEQPQIKDYRDTIFNVENKLFSIFKTNVFILENMGLLLTNDSGDNSISAIEIKRVKGLRKNSSHTMLDESIHKAITLDENKVIQSDVYHKLKDIFEIYLEDSNKDFTTATQNLTIQLKPYLEKIYDNKLYEQAVIKRFNDMETLAKKLTKENKSNRTLLDKFGREKITLKNFKIGDLALFLPTRDNIYLNRDPNLSVPSSLTSSFSSVDLSTPPILTSSVGEKIEFNKDSPQKKAEKPQQNAVTQPRIWAVFTAFDEATRYILKMDDNSLALKNRDWFIGKILTIDDINILDTGGNSFKLPKALTCYQVTAELVPEQI